MLKGLFDYGYKDVLLKKKSEYHICPYAIDLVFFLFGSYIDHNNRQIRENKYDNIDREYENELLYYISLFLEERSKQERG